MEWITNSNRYDDNKSNYFIEYEIASDKKIEGTLNYKHLCCKLVDTKKGADDLYHYTLRSWQISPIIPECIEDYEYDFKGEIYELIAIFGFFFSARFYYQSSCINKLDCKDIPWKTFKKHTYIPLDEQKDVDKFLSSEKDWNEVENLLEKINKIPAKNQQGLMMAINFYHLSLLMLSIDEELSYLYLVSSIESLLEDNHVSNEILEELEKLTENGIISKNLKSLLASFLKVQKITSRFRKFIDDHYKRAISDKIIGSKNHHGEPVTPKLTDLIDLIYSVRSSYLHSGVHFKWYHSLIKPRGSNHFNMDPYLTYLPKGKMEDRYEFNLPYWNSFEEIVSTCIDTWIEAKTEKN